MKYSNIKLYKTTYCADCRLADSFFKQNGITVNETVNIDENIEAANLVVSINNGHRSVPTIVINTEENKQIILVEPSWSDLTELFK